MVQPQIGTIGLPAKEFKEIVVEVTEDAVLARQAAHDTVMEVLSEVVTGQEARDALASIDVQGFAQIAADDPDEARRILQGVRKDIEEGRV